MTALTPGRLRAAYQRGLDPARAALIVGGDLTGIDVGAIAERLRLNVATFEADMESPAVKEQLDVEVRQGKVAGVRGTPTFFINGRVAQTRSLAGFKAMIEEELNNKSG